MTSNRVRTQYQTLQFSSVYELGGLKVGIASGIFWIMVGLLYILYQAFKAHPSDTILGAAFMLLFVGGMIAWYYLIEWLCSINLTLAGIVGFAGFAAAIGYLVHLAAVEYDKKQRIRDRYNKAMSIARREEIDEEKLKAFEKRMWERNYFDPSGHDKYCVERAKYIGVKDKSRFREMIIDDYIERSRVYEIMSELEEQEKGLESSDNGK